MPTTTGSTDHQVFTPADSEAVNTPLSDAEIVDYSELKTRKGARTAEERVRLHQYRLRSASGYAGHRFPSDADDEPEPQKADAGPYAQELKWAREHTYACFTDAPGAFVLTGNKVTGARASQIHRRLFGRSLPRARSVQHVPGAARTAARPRHRRDGSRRHSTRGGTGDDPAPEPDPEHSPPPNEGRRFCACGCGLDISHKRADATVYDATHRKRKQRHPDTPGEVANPYLTLSSVDRDALQAQALGGCRCNGSHVLDGEYGDCIKCGRPYRDDVPDEYVRLWALRDRMPSYIHAVAYDRSYGVTA